MPQLKPDAEQIKQFIQHISNQDWVRRTERRWWPRFLFHYTDLRNAVNVLEEGYLYSRKYLEDAGRLVVSSGSPAVLSGTDASIQDCVRLCFRPKTPTQYYAEGIHSRDSLARSRFPSAHCPVPVFFLFDSDTILTRADCRFSDRGLGSINYHIFSTAEEWRQLPWTKIYHTGPLPDNKNKRDIIACRMAEVIIPRRLDLADLRFIYCRSDAEKDTLLYLLSPNLRQRYQHKIVTTTRSALFFRRQTFVEKATLFTGSVHLRFSPDTQSPGPFSFKVTVESESGQLFAEETASFKVEPPYHYVLQLPNNAPRYRIHFLLDDHLAYANVCESIDDPL